MKDIPKPVIIGLAVLAVLLVVMLVFVDRTEATGEPPPDPNDYGWVGGIGVRQRLDVGTIVLRGCTKEGDEIRFTGACDLVVPGAEGFLGRARYRSFRLISVDGRTRLVSQVDRVKDAFLDPGALVDNRGDERETEVGVPPDGMTVSVQCESLGGCRLRLLAT